MRALLFIACTAIISVPALACSCKSGLTSCGQFSAASVAFVGTVSQGTGGDSDRPGDVGRSLATVRVETIVRGLPPRTIEIQVNPALGTSCFFPMKSGERWLILGGLHGDQVLTGGCSGSRPIRPSDTEVMESVDSFLTGPNLVRAEVRKYVGWDTRWNDKARLGKAEVVLRGAKGQWTRKTDDRGRATFREIPPGNYEFRVNVPGMSLGLPEDSRWSTPEKFSPQIQVEAKGCIDAPLTLWADQAIRGTVFDEDGHPLADVTVGAFEARGEDRVSTSSFRTAKTDTQGRYVLPRVPDGTYIVGANAEEGSDENARRPKYSPNKTSRQDAARIVLTGGGEEHVDILMDAPRRLIQVPVKVVFADGKPAARAYVSLERADAGYIQNLSEQRRSASNRCTGHGAISGVGRR